MSAQAKAVLLSWAKVFTAAALTAVLADLADGFAGFDWQTVLIAGLVSVLPVVINWLSSSDPRYGRGYVAPEEWQDAA